MTLGRGAIAARRGALAGLALALLAACASPRIVAVPAAGVQVDPARRAASVAQDGVELTVQSSAWRGAPWDLRDYVTPFFVICARRCHHPRSMATTTRINSGNSPAASEGVRVMSELTG